MPEPGENNIQGKSAQKREYIGQHYNNGIVMPDGQTLKPRDWTDKEISEYELKYPQVKDWFTAK